MLVFVYGTLKRGFPNFDEGLGNAHFVGKARTCLRFPMYLQGRWFAPAVVPEPGSGHRIAGEVFQAPETALKTLDEIEFVGKPGGFHHYDFDVELVDSGETLQALGYVRYREDIEAFHSEPIADYQDRRYVHRKDRP